jgi:hypothetical protein
MNHNHRQSQLASVSLLALTMGLTPLTCWSFNSGSTGSDGPFAPIVDTTLDLPIDGVLNFTTVTIPTGITVTFNKNVANTPVTLLASGDVTIDGTIDVSGGNSTAVGAAGDGNPGDDGLYGIGGPGGFNGGRGGMPTNIIGAAGLGPGAGNQSRGVNTAGTAAGTGCGGSGAGYLSVGQSSQSVAIDGKSNADSNSVCDSDNDQALGGKAYGAETLLPLVGGSGGGGAGAGRAFAGSGGGGGGGAILIASSGTVTINGKIKANGGTSGSAAGSLAGGTGGGGSGGAVRIIATTIAGDGDITALGGSAGTYALNDGSSQGGSGSDGRIRLEADLYKRTMPTLPAFSFATPQDMFVAGLPSLRISSVAGVIAPVSPTGNADIILPQSTPNPVIIELATTGVPIGNTVELTVTPASGPSVSVTSAAITGSKDAGLTSVSVNLPDGPSVLSAAVSFSVSVAMDKQSDLSRFTQGDPVKRIHLNANTSTGSLTTLVTETGREYSWPANPLTID